MENFYSSNIDHAAYLLQKGGIVAFPTETVYGLGASVFCLPAIARIFHVKGRPSDNPLIVHISNLDQLSLVAKNIPNEFFLLAEAFFPGPLTVLLPKHEDVSNVVSANLPTIGIRMPSHPIALELIGKTGVPLVAPSANISGKPSSTTAQHVQEDFGEKIDALLDGGPCYYGIESTVLMLAPKPTILRPGAISQSQIEEVLKCQVDTAKEHSDLPLSPGMKYRHYAPKAKVSLFTDLEQLLVYQTISKKNKKITLTSVTSQELYITLRQADADGVEEICIFCDTTMLHNKALMDRLTRAANPHSQ